MIYPNALCTRGTHKLTRMIALAIGFLGTALSGAFAQASGAWTLTGGLNTPREGHTATLLPNGQVLVAGGEGATGVLASAELYNPATRHWTMGSPSGTGGAAEDQRRTRHPERGDCGMASFDIDMPLM